MLVEVLVKPGSKKGSLVEVAPSGALTVFLREKPHDGEANAALIKMLSNYFRVPKTSIFIKSGQKSRKKIVEIAEL